MNKQQRSELKQWMSAIRRELHQYPETKYEEVRTTARIKDALDELGISNHTFDDVTGVVGLISNKADGPTLALRADIDALPMTEQTNAEYASKIPGKMHACGHDANTAVMLGVAKFLVDSGYAERLPGNLKFIFQPAEEGGAGAQRLIDKGVLKDPDVDWIIAGHAFPDLNVGETGFYHRQSHASSDTFTLTIRGKGTHGARPHTGNDPLVAVAQFINMTHGIIARNVDPLESGVLSIGKLEAGTTSNVIPDKAVLEGTMRTLNPEVRSLLKTRLQEVCRGLELSLGVSCELEIVDGYPPCMGDPEVSGFLYDTAVRTLGEENASWLAPTTGSEDFAFYTQVLKGSICRIGCRNEAAGMVQPLHSPLFDLDEEMLINGAEFFKNCVLGFFDMDDSENA